MLTDLLHTPQVDGGLFYDIALLLLVTVLFGLVAIALRQPLIVAFIAVGVLAGPAGMALVRPGPELELLAEIGIALLLFVVGLKLDLSLIRSMGPVALATGLGQVAFTSIAGFLISVGLGMSPVTAVYVAVALTFSSTIIIVKLLSDKREIDALHGRIALGFLIVQDIVVVIVMIVLSAFGIGGEGIPVERALLAVAVRGGLFIVALGVLMRYVLPRLLHVLARSQELLVLFAITWAVLLAALGEWLGLSSEVGAFLGGVSLASTHYREAIGSRLISLRDFLLLFFFIELGAHLDLSLLGAQIIPALVLSLFVLVGNPIIVMVIMGYMGYRRRTGFLAGLTVAQISEFSLILAALGFSLGHIDEQTVGLITLVGLITIGLSTYLILNSHTLYRRLAPVLQVFERKIPHREAGSEGDTSRDIEPVMIFGLGRFGGRLSESLRERGVQTHGVDFDPEMIKEWHQKDLPAHYGDAEDPDFPGVLPLTHVRWVVSSVPWRETNMTLLHSLRNYGYAGSVAVTAHNMADAEALLAAGADRVLLPFMDAAEQAAEELAALIAASEEVAAEIPPSDTVRH